MKPTKINHHKQKQPVVPTKRSFSQPRKTVFITLVSIAAVAVLIFLLFFASRFVGKAIDYTVPSQGNEAGIFVQGGQETVGQRFLVPIKAKILSPAVGVSFALQYPAELIPDCNDKSTIFSSLDQEFTVGGNSLAVIRKIECLPPGGKDNLGLIIFEYAGLCADVNCSNALSGELTIANIPFTASEPGQLHLTFTDFTIIKLDDTLEDLIGNGVSAILTVVAPPFQEPIPEPVSSPSSPSRGGRRCVPQWNCENYWSICNATLQQSKVCYDQKVCNRQLPTKLEVRECQPCSESWVCESYGSCQNGIQTRTCIDENACGTYQFKPVLQQSCSSGQAPVQTKPLPPPPPKEQPLVIPSQSFWDNNKAIITGSGLGLLILLIVTMVVMHLVRHPKMAYNFNELKNWVKQEKQMGTPNEDIKQILHEHTGWKEEEIEEVFLELKEREDSMAGKAS